VADAATALAGADAAACGAELDDFEHVHPANDATPSIASGASVTIFIATEVPRRPPARK
jgi:hypothetical protein